MSATVSLRHTIFDPASDYFRIHGRLSEDLKMRGYFHLMDFEASLAESKPHELNGHVLRDSSDWTAILSGKAHAPFRAVDARLGRGLCFDGTVETFSPAFLLVREAGGSRSASLAIRGEGFPPLAERGRCRAFLIEEGMIDHMASVVGCPREQALERGFDPEAPGGIHLRRLLVAIPDLDEAEGSDARVLRFQRVPIMDGPDSFPPHQGPLSVVLVFDRADSVS